jgi:hypothetical protein
VHESLPLADKLVLKETIVRQLPVHGKLIREFKSVVQININRMIKRTWEMHAPAPIAQVKYYEILLSQKR